MHPTKDTTVGTVYLDADAEARFLAHVKRAGGRVLTTGDESTAEAVGAALEAVQRTLAVLEHVLTPDDLPAIVQDVVPRDLSA